MFFFQDLKYFLLDNGCRSIFLEASRVDENGNGSPICEESIQFIVNKLMEFINLKYSMHKWDEVEDVCKAAVVIFPSIDLVRKFNIHFSGLLCLWLLKFVLFVLFCYVILHFTGTTF